MRRNLNCVIKSQREWLSRFGLSAPAASCHTSRFLGAMSREEEEDELVRQLIQQSDLHDYSAPVAQTSIASVRPQASLSQSVGSSSLTASGSAAPDRPTDNRGNPEVPTHSHATQVSSPDTTPPALKFVSVRRPNSGILEWQCLKCSSYHRLSQTSCRTCGMPASASHRTAQPMPARHVAIMPSEWYCNTGVCRHLNRTPSPAEALLQNSNGRMQRERYTCSSCAQPFQGVHDWLCNNCSCPNARAAVQCTSCFANRAVGWACKACGETRNSIFSMSCASCNKLREPSRQHAGATVHCPSCDAINQSNWEVCTVCVSPLPTLLCAIGAKEEASPAMRSVRYREPPTRAPDIPKCVPSGIVETPAVSDSLDPSLVTTSPAEVGRGVPCIPVGSNPVTQAPEPEYDRNFGVAPTWTCNGCGAVHRMKMPFCDNCLASRSKSVQQQQPSVPPKSPQPPAATTSKERSAPSLPHNPSSSSEGSWTCHACFTRNSPFSKGCLQCREPRKLPSGYWQCLTCFSVNRRARLMCIGCSDLQPQLGSALVMPGTSVVGAKWACNKCAFDGNPSLSNRCQNCGVDRASWQCRCEHVNALSLSNCASCGVSRDSGGHSCGACHAVNPLGSERCDKCGHNLQADTRWTCANCGCADNDLLVSGACVRCNSVNKLSDDTKGLWLCPTCRSSNLVQDVHHQQPSTGCRSCHYCETPQPDTCKTFPLRWPCHGCGTRNVLSASKCRDCNAKRSLDWGFLVDCPACRKSTMVDATEACVHCDASLTTLVSSLFKKLVVDDEEIAQYKLADAKQAPASEVPAATEHAAGAPVVALGESPSVESVAPALASWGCSLCGSRNDSQHAECESCGMPKDL